MTRSPTRYLAWYFIAALALMACIGYARAARLVDQLEEAGILGADQGGSNGRDYLPAHNGQPGPSATGGIPVPRIIGDAPTDEEPPTQRPRVWM